MSKPLTCGECEHFKLCQRKRGSDSIKANDPECPARTSERELLMVLEAVEWVEGLKGQGPVGPRWWFCPWCAGTKYEGEDGRHIPDCILHKAIQKAKGKGK